jgi:cold shock CspA family protein
MMDTGTVKFWKRREHDKPFGFIVPDNPNEADVYFDARGFVDKSYIPRAGDRVRFGRGRKGRFAKYIELYEDEFETLNEGI